MAWIINKFTFYNGYGSYGYYRVSFINFMLMGLNSFNENICYKAGEQSHQPEKDIISIIGMEIISRLTKVRLNCISSTPWQQKGMKERLLVISDVNGYLIIKFIMRAGMRLEGMSYGMRKGSSISMELIYWKKIVIRMEKK